MERVGSISDYMEIFEELEAAASSERVSFSDCESLEIVTMREAPGRTFCADEEMIQRLLISKDGQVQLRANTYHHGPGHYGIGRILDVEIPPAAVQEIIRLLDTWLFTRDQAWTISEDVGKWYLRVRQHGGKEQIQRGILDGAFVMEMDVSQFIRERVPVDSLYLFDQDFI